MVKRVIFGEVKNEKVEKLMDLSPREFFLMLLLSLFVLIIGIKPGILTDKMSVSIDRLIDQLEYGKSVSKHSILSSSIEVSSKNTFLSGTSK